MIDEDHEFTEPELFALGRYIVSGDDRCAWTTGHHGEVRCQLPPQHVGWHFAYFASQQIHWLNFAATGDGYEELPISKADLGITLGLIEPNIRELRAQLRQQLEEGSP